jgi:hypothetical protein
MPYKPLRGRVRSLLIATVAVAAAASLIVWPLPAALAETCLALGLMAATLILLWPEELLARMLVGLTFALASLASVSAHKLQPSLAWPRWEPIGLVIAVSAAAVAIAGLVSAARRPRLR